MRETGNQINQMPKAKVSIFMTFIETHESFRGSESCLGLLLDLSKKPRTRCQPSFLSAEVLITKDGAPSHRLENFLKTPQFATV